MSLLTPLGLCAASTVVVSTGTEEDSNRMKIDNFALTMFQTCPIKYFLRMKEDWTSRRRSGALGFGGAIHEGLAEWYKTRDKAAALLAIDAAWPNNLPTDDWRTKEKCLAVMVEYMREYPQESFKVIGAPEAPLVEVNFTIATGMYLDDGEEIEYGGIFDGGAEFTPSRYILEHKTTTQLGKPPHAWYFQQFKPNNQVTGYIWALGRLTGQPVGGAIINAIGLYKNGPAKFARTITSRSEDEIASWLRNVRATCQMIRDCEKRDYWPLHTQACTMYGKCEFHDVHVLGTEVERQKQLEMLYVKQEWQYEHRDEGEVVSE